MNIVKRYKLWFSISLLIILIGGAMGAINGVNLGIDFSGGTMIQVNIGREFTVDEIDTIIEKFELKPEILHAGLDKHEVLIRTKESLSNDERKEIFDEIKNNMGLTDSDFLGAEQFEPTIGGEITKKALYSILIAGVGMLAYITFRFEIKFGVSAVIALVHDVLILLAIYTIFRLPINSSFIAAILTVVGYSINDTIVVFDRLRENLKITKKKDFFQIADDSLKQTLTRSINTSMTTLLVIGSLYVLGVTSIKELALPLLAGVLTGTYSSIFIASPVWALWKTKTSK